MRLLIKNIKGLVQYQRFKVLKKIGREMSHLPVMENAWLLAEDGKISAFGKMSELNSDHADLVIDATDRFVLPSWIDSHTHLVYAASREDEFVMKIKGASYEEIFNKGGGILNSASRLRNTSEEELFESAKGRLDEVIRLGTGAIEIKSGYGLSLEGEIKILRVIKKLKDISPIMIKSTFLGAHAIPLEFKDNRRGYIDLIIKEMLPVIAKEKLADYIDVFCDKGFFTIEETSEILEAGINIRLKPRLHANEMDFSGGVQTGVKFKAISVDHLECTGDNEIKTLLLSTTMPTLMPSTAFYLNLNYAPARKMIDAGLPVSVASDYNPGTSPSGNMNFTISLACIKMKMTPEEAINAATVNASYALELNDRLGAIAPGYIANMIITRPMPSIAFIPYSFGNPVIQDVIINGNIYQGLKK
jgi:imidazolonepropionase